MNISENELLKLGSRDKVPLTCKCCGDIFYITKNNVLYARSDNKKGLKYIYCSRKCNGISKINSKNVECNNCGKIFSKSPARIKNRNFCSQSCSGTYINTHKTKGNCRSKLEIWLESKLTKIYPNLEIHFNRKDTINSELDIYIPSLKLAFELNGIFHYEPIYGEEQLSKIKNNDKRKFQACLENKIELCIIDTSKQKYFKESTSLEYFKIIFNIINNKIGGHTGN